MNLRKISNLVRKAKREYVEKTENYNQFLNNNIQVNSLNAVLKASSFKQAIVYNQKIRQQQLQQMNQNSQLQNMGDVGNNDLDSGGMMNSGFGGPMMSGNGMGGGGYAGPNINVVGNGGNPTAPINIIAKNYINPNSFENDFDDDIVEEKSKKSKQLAKIPDKLLKESATDWEPINYRGVDDSYKLYDLASVEIKYDEETQKLLYKIIEPELTEYELEALDELKKGFIYVFEKFSPEFINMSERELIVKGTQKLASKYNIKLDETQFKNVVYYLARDFLGLELIEPIFHDPFIEDISCDGLNIPLFVNHLKYGPLEVNRKYTDPAKLNSFIVKLAQKSNEEISLSKPILQGALPDGSRVEAIYGKEISEKGSSFTIRKFREEPFTPIHLIEFGTMPPFLLAYLWLAVENKQSILVSGGTATGKTTILNALSLFVPPTAKIVSIEDTPEINLPHEHWLPMISRDSNSKVQVSMFDLLKASLRERPDYIIVGEIRGKEAAILFQGMATGHAGLGTVHADKFEDLVNRMTIDPINLPKQLLTEVKLVLFQKQVKVKDNIVRRTASVVEIIDYNSKSDKFTINEFMKYTPITDAFDFKEDSGIISNLIALRGGKEESIWNEIEKRRRILDYMHKNNLLEFKDVGNVFKAYYKDPASIFDYMDQLIQEKKNKEEEENQLKLVSNLGVKGDVK